MKIPSTLAATLIGLAAAANCFADAIPYPGSGAPNPAGYSFAAAVSGGVSAYFLGSDAAYSESLGLLVNGVDTGSTGLPNLSTPIGTQLNFGHVHAGDTLVFYIRVATTGDTWYSDAALNADGSNHVYSTAYTGDAAPQGIYVGFEDLPAAYSDFNYRAEQFVFTSVLATPAVGEPTGMSLLLAGVAMLALVARRLRAAGPSDGF